MISYSADKKREIIMDYYLNPRRKKQKVNDLKKNTYIHSSSCVDEIKLFYNDEKDDFQFEAQGCAIFLSSTEIFLERLLEVKFDYFKKLCNLYEKLINNDSLLDEEIEYLGKLNIFSNVKKHLNRVECALLITNALKQI